MEQALKWIAFVSVVGLLFSGFLTYNEMFRGSCAVGGCSYVIKLPACVYGFVMYAILLILSILGLHNGEKKRKR